MVVSQLRQRRLRIINSSRQTGQTLGAVYMINRRKIKLFIHFLAESQPNYQYITFFFRFVKSKFYFIYLALIIFNIFHLIYCILLSVSVIFPPTKAHLGLPAVKAVSGGQRRNRANVPEVEGHLSIPKNRGYRYL
jgi:hypothetical protein